MSMQPQDIIKNALASNQALIDQVNQQAAAYQATDPLAQLDANINDPTIALEDPTLAIENPGMLTDTTPTSANSDTTAQNIIQQSLAANQNLIKTAQNPAPTSAVQASPSVPSSGFDASNPNLNGPTQASFQKSLQQLIAGAGGKVSITSGTRSLADQTKLWNQAVSKYGSTQEASKWVAPPGSSAHELGIAADLNFSDPATASWVHQNAAKYGIYFPLSNEPWHAQLINSNNPTFLNNLRSQVFGGKGSAVHPSTAPVGSSSTPLPAGVQSTGDPNLDWILNHEDASRSTTAKNPKSTAFGLGQLLDYNRASYAKQLGIADPNTTNYNDQLAMMKKYISDRYGTTSQAKSFWQGHGWY